MNIARFAIGRLRNEEWFQYHTEFSNLVAQNGAEALGLERLFPLYRTLCKEADRLLELLHLSFITAESSLADRLRTKAFRGLRDAVKANLHLTDIAKQTAAEKLIAVIRKYSPAILQGSLVGKTPAVENLLQDLKANEGGIDLSAEVQTLHLSAWVDDLEQANRNYAQSVVERTTETAARPEAGLLKQLRIRIDHYYVTMANAIDVTLLAIEGESAAKETTREAAAPSAETDQIVLHFAKSLNACTVRYTTLLRGRITRGNHISKKIIQP
ncbi:MAG: DUF6261 family protein [Tannerellaceae bacterium]|nr:DUF6261 family protein [Tannerellaceae bacterium]